MVTPGNVALIGARNLDPPEETFIAESGIHTGPDAVDRALEDCSCVYVAFDVDSLDPGEITPFMPEPDGLTLDEVERLFIDLACNTCHLSDGRGRGPSLDNKFGDAERLASGGTVQVDEAYLRESILRPQAKIVDGYQVYAWSGEGAGPPGGS
jgi:hypothetical protein